MKYKFVTAEEQSKRITTCNSCDELRKVKVDILNTCKVCNCLVGVKSWLADQDCPLDKWSNKE